MLLLAGHGPPDCTRYRGGADLQSCEVERQARDVLNGARRPPAAALGEGAIRFSTQPALGGRAMIFEVRRRRDGTADARLFLLYGHSAHGWTDEGRRTFRLMAPELRPLTRTVAAAFADEAVSIDSDGAIIVCTDGPGFATEKVEKGKVLSLTGSCGSEHPNTKVACAVRSLLVGRVSRADRAYLPDRRRCAAPDRPQGSS